jgi:hypothetical protein
MLGPPSSPVRPREGEELVPRPTVPDTQNTKLLRRSAGQVVPVSTGSIRCH